MIVRCSHLGTRKKGNITAERIDTIMATVKLGFSAGLNSQTAQSSPLNEKSYYG